MSPPVLTTFVQPRPWLSLYGVHIRPTALPQVELALIQKLLPDEMMHIVLSKLPAYTLGVLACVCRHWRILAEHPKLWEHACSEALQLSYPQPQSLHMMLLKAYKGSWKRMFLEHPHLRFDGLYVSRNTYIRTGATEFSRGRNPVHVVSYYRYYRFFPDGTLLYSISPNTVSKIAKSMRTRPREPQTKEQHIFTGRYALKGSKVYIALLYPGSWSTEVRSKLSLRSTHLGANNRLDIESIVTFDRELGTASMVMDGPEPGEELDGEGQRREHKRGLTSAVFVTWEAVNTSVLNLPPSQMDFFMPG